MTWLESKGLPLKQGIVIKRYIAMVCPFPFSLICFLYPLSLILVSFLGKLFRPPFEQRR